MYNTYVYSLIKKITAKLVTFIHRKR